MVINSLMGTDATGTRSVPNNYAGIMVDGDNATIGSIAGGGDTRNIASGNSFPGSTLGVGVYFRTISSGSTLVNTFIGTDITGTKALPNKGQGIFVDGVGAIIGVAGFNNTNIVAGNNGAGLWTGFGLDSVNGYINCKVVNTYFGLDVSGTVGIPNVAGGLDLHGSGHFIGSIVGGAQSRVLISGHVAEAPLFAVLINRGSNDNVM